MNQSIFFNITLITLLAIPVMGKAMEEQVSETLQQAAVNSQEEVASLAQHIAQTASQAKDTAIAGMATMANQVKNGLKDAGHYTLERGAQMTDWCLEKGQKGLKSASEQGHKAVAWAQQSVPACVMTWVSDHPYVSIAAVTAPICLFIGYKLGAKSEIEDNK